MRGRSVALVALAAGLLVLSIAGCGGGSGSGSNGSGLTDLTNVLELRGAFNEDEGTPRLVLLLSPT